MKYTGNNPCLGCGQTGQLRPRRSKDSLCDICTNDLKLGRDIRPEIKPEDFTHVALRYHSISLFDSDFDNEGYGKQVESAISNLIKSLDRRNVKSSSTIELTPSHAITGSHHATIKSDSADAIKLLVDALLAQQERYKSMLKWLKGKRDNIELEKQSAIEMVKNQERNKIFNEGVSYGKQLLIQLNNGGMTLNEFDKEIKKY